MKLCAFIFTLCSIIFSFQVGSLNEEAVSLKERYPAEEEPIQAKEVELNECWDDLKVLVCNILYSCNSYCL